MSGVRGPAARVEHLLVAPLDAPGSEVDVCSPRQDARLQELVVSAADRALERGLAAGVASSVGMADFVGLVPGPPPSGNA